jgi:superfamily I DNA/RNA helicase
VTTFVRKLAADLRADLNSNDGLIEIHTLHSLARSIVERNHGTSRVSFSKHIKIITQPWDEVVWKDALAIVGIPDQEQYQIEDFQEQLYSINLNTTDKNWARALDAYNLLCSYYNAAGFADLILRAAKALKENKQLNNYDHFIIDEHQDFNKAEEELIKILTSNADNILIAGDDDQVLYDGLKKASADIIRGRYSQTADANAMLPFCSRCNYHIVKVANHFISKRRKIVAISKVFLPLQTDDQKNKVRLIGCARPSTTVDYISEFIKDHRDAIEQRKKILESGTEKADPYLMILTPTLTLQPYYKGLKESIAEFGLETNRQSDDYLRVLAYEYISLHPEDNFGLRKILHYEKTPHDKITSILNRCLQEEKQLFIYGNTIINNALKKSQSVKSVLESDYTAEDQAEALSKIIPIQDVQALTRDLLTRNTQNSDNTLELNEQETAELTPSIVSSVELLTFGGAKGLSADHVIILGFDNVNMNRATVNSFYVAMTRARESLHIITTLRLRGAKEPHEYINSLPEEHVEFFQYKKGDKTLYRVPTKEEHFAWFKSLQSWKR